MPASSGASHGIAAFATLIIGTVMSKWIWELMPPLGEASVFVITSIRSMTGADILVSEQFAGAVVVMVFLSFLWGILYHFKRHA